MGNKGRISRYLANKCSIASRIDSFGEKSTRIFGEHMKQQCEDRLAFLTEGVKPRKNIDVMNEAMKALEAEVASEAASASKKRPAANVASEEAAGGEPTTKKKKKSSKTEEAITVEGQNLELTKKKKKKDKKEDVEPSQSVEAKEPAAAVGTAGEEPTKKKKKKDKAAA